MWARINNGAVAEITDTDPKDRFHPSIQWEPAGKSVEVGDLFDGQSFSKPPGEQVEDLAAGKLNQINAAYTQALAPLIKTYPDIEALSWDAQRKDAEAYQAWLDGGSSGDAPATPVLDKILQGRTEDGSSETLAELVSKVLANAQAFIDSQLLTGRRHRLEKRINAILDDEQLTDDEKRATLEAIEWPEA